MRVFSLVQCSFATGKDRLTAGRAVTVDVAKIIPQQVTFNGTNIFTVRNFCIIHL